MSPVGKFSGHTNLPGFEVVDHVGQRLVARQERVDEHGALALPLDDALVLQLADRAGGDGPGEPEAFGDVLLLDADHIPGSWRAVGTSNMSQARRLPTCAVPAWFDVLGPGVRMGHQF
jgi:hypothetical protein